MEQGLSPRQLAAPASESLSGLGRGPRLGHVDPISFWPWASYCYICYFATLWPLGCAQGMPNMGWY